MQNEHIFSINDEIVANSIKSNLYFFDTYSGGLNHKKE